MQWLIATLNERRSTFRCVSLSLWLSLAQPWESIDTICLLIWKVLHTVSSRTRCQSDFDHAAGMSCPAATERKDPTFVAVNMDLGLQGPGMPKGRRTNSPDCPPLSLNPFIAKVASL